jgi:replicative DNA helicase
MADMTAYIDVTAEWKLLAKLTHAENIAWLERLSAGLFTHQRVNIYHAIQNTYIAHGTVSYEGIKLHNKGVVPGELLAATGGNIHALVDELGRLARKRAAARVAATLTELSKAHDPSIDEIQRALVYDPILAEEDSFIGIGAQELLADLLRKQSGEYNYARTGFRFLDNSMGGEWKQKSLVMYLGASGSGKTTLVAQSMLAMARGYINETTGENVITPSLFFSLEMAKSDLMVKWLGNELNIDTQKIQSGKLTPAEFKRIEDHSVDIQKLPMYVIDNGAITLGQMIYEIKKHVFNKGVRVVFIDYLQIVNHSIDGNDNKALGEFAQAMKAIAKREGITVAILSQITEGNTGSFRIRNSGDVGASADVIFEGGLEDHDELVNDAIRAYVVNRLKNRFGSTGKTGLLFNGPYQRFEEASM